MKKKLIGLLLSVLMCFSAIGLAACGKGEDGGTSDAIKLKVWGSQQDQFMLGVMADSFKAANPDKKYDFKFGVVGEKEVRAKIGEDPAAAADVFSFPDDQILEMQKAQMLYELPASFATRAKEANMQSSVDAATIGDKMYAFPETADNTYFMFYDKRVVTDAQAGKLDDILAACQAAGKKFLMDLSNGWYIASFFLSEGCSLSIGTNGKQVCDFNSEAGLRAAASAEALAKHPSFITGEDDLITGSTGMGAQMAVAITGTWNTAAIKEKLGDNMGVAKLPTYTSNGQQVQLKSFGGYKLAGVLKTTKYPEEAVKFAEWITNEANQLYRFTERQMGPSNKAAAASSAVAADAAMAAVTAQMAHSVTQREVLSAYWTPAEALGTALESKDYGGKTLQELVQIMVAQITA